MVLLGNVGEPEKMTEGARQHQHVLGRQASQRATHLLRVDTLFQTRRLGYRSHVLDMVEKIGPRVIAYGSTEVLAEQVHVLAQARVEVLGEDTPTTGNRFFGHRHSPIVSATMIFCQILQENPVVRLSISLAAASTTGSSSDCT